MFLFVDEVSRLAMQTLIFVCAGLAVRHKEVAVLTMMMLIGKIVVQAKSAHIRRSAVQTVLEHTRTQLAFILVINETVIHTFYTSMPI